MSSNSNNIKAFKRSEVQPGGAKAGQMAPKIAQAGAISAAGQVRSQQQQQQTRSLAASDSNLDNSNNDKQQPTTTSASAPQSTSRLVFGLSSKTNRLKHDEYAAERQRQSLPSSNDNTSLVNFERAEVKQQQQQAALSTTTGNRLINKQTVNHQPAKELTMNAAEQSKNNNNSNNCSATQSAMVTTNSNNNIQRNDLSKDSNDNRIRASKYGNFYKPQDLVNSSAAATPEKPDPVAAVVSNNNSTKKIRSISASHKQLEPEEEKQQQQQQATTITESLSTTKQRGKSPTRAKQQVSSLACVESTNGKSAMVDQQQRVGRIKTKSSSSSKSPVSSRESSPAKKSTSDSSIAATDDNNSSSNPIQQQPIRMQFNIPPPRQINNNSRNSAVSYAKSRIYDKPIKHQQQQQQRNNIQLGSTLFNSNDNIPESILCGFKPPKQVIVSKAREKWEGGEPFAKCKSRQRLAAAQQANKKLLGGTWSMTSVVATQQLQFQQALNASSQSRLSINNNNLLEPSVKILTRGSVLERVQQFEKAPAGSSVKGNSADGSGGSLDSSGSECSSLSDTELSDDNEIEEEEEELMINNNNKSIPSENSKTKHEEPTKSKQALYKSKVSSIQQTKNSSQDLLSSASNSRSPPISSSGSGSSSSSHQSTTRRRSSLTRRRSSTTSTLGGNNSSYSNIPKFYHPNGKPNTYEIELEKKNIVACFDKFPERKALLSGPNCKRHFHSIALACGFSEYFKEPLFLYVKNKMLNSNLLHNNSGGLTNNGASQQHNVSRKQSSVEINLEKVNEFNNNKNLATKLPNNQSTANQQKLLLKANSIDTSTMEKIQNQNFITCDQFLICWRQIISSCFDLEARFVHLLTFGSKNYLLPDDFVPLIQSIIDDHPGLKFLRAAPDFHMRYIQTVIARIYFNVNRSWTGKITICELRRSNLLAVLQVLSQEEDINQITDYFSYEHFYVIYCKFWNLDQDHDLLISKEDLARHNDAAISSRIIERIFMGIVSKQIQLTGKMSYSDFVWFLLAEEDKKHPRAIEYWFRLMDIDGDGYVSMYEMEYFYYEQVKRLELMNIEALPFIDSACQILDLVNPKEKNKISLADLKRTKMATIFFDTFINLEKYLEHESREFVSTRDIIQDGVLISDWDRYASEEYENLVTEETSV